MNSKNTKPEMTYGQAMNGLNFEGLSEHTTLTLKDYIKRRVRTLNALVLDCKTLMECGASKQEIAANKQMITLTRKFLSTDALTKLMEGAVHAEFAAKEAAEEAEYQAITEAETAAEVAEVHEIVAAVVKPKKATKAKKVEQEPVAEAEVAFMGDD